MNLKGVRTMLYLQLEDRTYQKVTKYFQTVDAKSIHFKSLLWDGMVYNVIVWVSEAQ